MADVRAVGEGGGSIIVNCVLSMHIRVFIQLSMHIPSTYEPFNSSCFVVAPFFVSLYSYGSRATWHLGFQPANRLLRKTSAAMRLLLLHDYTLPMMTQLHGSSDGLVATDDAEAHG